VISVGCRVLSLGCRDLSVSHPLPGRVLSARCYVLSLDCHVLFAVYEPWLMPFLAAVYEAQAAAVFITVWAWLGAALLREGVVFSFCA
jgi:hypothetical protein